MKFQPILKEKVWGGNKLSTLFGKKFVKNAGESWELSGVEGSVSVVSNGILKGKDLNQIIEIFKHDLLGKKVFKHFGNTFPLLFKFIDANQDLSIQLHPDDKLAQKRHDSFGKTEMWYVMQAEKEARLILGFKEDMSEEGYLKALSENKITEIIHSEYVNTGDSFFIAPGTVHAIGAGIVLAEIQQTSDITYRIYDWDRLGINGELRELHTDLALAAISFKKSDAKLPTLNNTNNELQLCSVEYFEANKIVLTENMERDFRSLDSFVVYMCVEGVLTVEMENFSETLKKGETVLIPAAIQKINLNTNKATILEVYIP